MSEWVVCTSKTTGLKYLYHPTRNESVWLDDTLPEGWGWKRAVEGAVKQYVNLASGLCTTERPTLAATQRIATTESISTSSAGGGGAGSSEAAPTDVPEEAPHQRASLSRLPPGADQPTPLNIALDIYIPQFRDRRPWLLQQLGTLAEAELSWWRSIAGKSAAVEPLLDVDREGHRVLPRASEGGSSSLQDIGWALIRSIIVVLGEDCFGAGWDPKTRRYLIRRESVPGFIAVPAPVHQLTGKRAREEGPPPAAPTAFASADLPVSAWPVVRSSAVFPRVTGAALYREPAFHSSPLIASIYTDGKITTASGVTRNVNAAVGPRESRHMYCLVKDNAFKRCLEVGMANGLSALSMCQAMQDNGCTTGAVVSIDPFQSTQWDNTARANLERAALSHLSRVIEKTSYAALPELLESISSGKEAPFDLVFVDGMHLFDYTLVDLFYADLVCRVGGVILLDDVRHRGVQPVYEYVKRNYPHWRLVPDTVCADTLATFIKVSEDRRSWDFHVSF